MPRLGDAYAFNVVLVNDVGGAGFQEDRLALARRLAGYDNDGTFITRTAQKRQRLGSVVGRLQGIVEEDDLGAPGDHLIERVAEGSGAADPYSS